MAMYLGSNKVEIGVNNGGGGSSDFSTAEVTVTDSTEGSAGLVICAIGDSNVDYGAVEAIAGVSGGGTFIMPLYKGHASAYTQITEITVNTTGAVEYDDGWFDITGDCTITIS